MPYGMALAVLLGSTVDTLSWRSGAEIVKRHNQMAQDGQRLILEAAPWILTLAAPATLRV